MAGDQEVEGLEDVEWTVLQVGEAWNAMTEILLEHAENLHVRGEPLIWFVERVIAAAPNLKRIRFVPAWAHLLEPERTLVQILDKRGVEILVGNEKPRQKRTDVASSYRNKHYFLLQLDDERKKLLPDLQRFAAKEWEVTSRYFCLNGEQHINLHDLAREREMSTNALQEYLATVLYFLDSPFDAPLRAADRARMVHRRIEEGHEDELEAADRKARLTALDLVETDLPEGLRRDLFETYAIVLRGWRHDSLSEQSITPRERRVLVRRYGLEDKIYRTLEEVGAELGVVRERVRQIETVALKRLRELQGLSTPSPDR